MDNQKLTSLHLISLHHAEFGQFIVRFFEDFSQTSLDANTDADFKRMFDALQNQIPNYNSALDQIRASEESEKIANADKVRDTDVQALKDSIKPYRNAKAQTEKDAYTSIKILLDQYKGVEDASYEEETNKLNTLITKLQSPEYSSQVATLGIVKFVNHLSDSNTAFNDLFAHRSYQTSQKQTYDVKVLRKTLTNDYRQMANYTATLANVKTDAFYKDALAVINNGRKYFSDVLARRSGKPSPPKTENNIKK
ncbi:DUF6261 family protein [Chryseobacterium limigenitum]|uniref:Uncharacterized protein n=1 Tax=Chryseobacterium limigenitum TaxID=1612149 RepID=A0A1K2IGA2_9FLAO|nr:DUF6261 family protein [Chryseobacterium limigenitum]SFZ91318.1 hypothetical protein SAMN05216324_102299 [Chryseobacterium limigenitum]